MNFEEKEIIAAGMIGFDMIHGPEIKWYQEFKEGLSIDMESFLMNFYLSFRGGDDELQPISILYNGFYIVAFPRGLELICLFLKPDNLSTKIERLYNIASEMVSQMDIKMMGVEEYSTDDDKDEIKRLVINLLTNQEVSTPELRRYFKLSNSEIWGIMSELEDEKRIARTQKIGRSQYWTAATV